MTMCALKVGSGERDGALRVEGIELDEEFPSQSSGRSMFIEGVVDVDEEGQLPGKKYTYQGQGRSQTKIQLTKETILLSKLKGPRSRYANHTAYLIFGRKAGVTRNQHGLYKLILPLLTPASPSPHLKKHHVW